MFVPADGNNVRADLSDLAPEQLQQLDGILRNEGITTQWAGSVLTVDGAYEARATSLVDQLRQAAPPPGAGAAPAAPAAPGVPPAPQAQAYPQAQGYPQPQGYPQAQAYPGAQPYGYAPAAAPTNSNATIALICAIVAWVVCPFIPAVVAVILGRKAQKEIAESGGTQGGEGLAKAAVIIGWINIGFTVFFGAIWLLIVLVALLGSSS